MFNTETVLLSLSGEHADQRLALRRAYLSGAIVRSSLVRRSRPVRIVDYAETFQDGCFEIAVGVVLVDVDAAARRAS